MKFDLTRKSIAAFTELAKIHREEGAVRAAVISGSSEKAGVLTIAGGEYVLVKAPALEGTELWLIPSGRQQEFELSMGFEKASVPLMTFAGRRLDGLEVLRDPEGDDTYIIRVETD